EKKRHAGFVAIVGRPNAGKSTLLNRFVGQKVAIVTSKPQTTRNRIQGIVTHPQGPVVFIDTPGVHEADSSLNRQMMREVAAALEGIDVLLLMVDAIRALQQGILLRQRPYGIHHQQQYINPFQRRRYLAHHLPVQRRIGLVHTRRINEHHLPLRVRHDPLNAVARGLRLGRDDGHLLPHEPVQQRGLPCVRPAHDGHESRVPFLFFSCCHCFFVHDSSFFPCLATHPSTISWALAKPPPANAARAAATLFAGSPPPLQTETLPDQPCPPARELFRKHGSATPQSSSPSRRMHRRSGRRATPPRVKSSCCRAAPGCHPLPSQHPARAASRRRRFRPQSPPLDLRPSQCPPRSHARQSPPPAPGPFAASHGAGPSPALFPEQTALGA